MYMYAYTSCKYQSLEKQAKSSKTRKPSGNVSDLECPSKEIDVSVFHK